MNRYREVNYYEILERMKAVMEKFKRRYVCANRKESEQKRELCKPNLRDENHGERNNHIMIKINYKIERIKKRN